jgi:hypothetical protein
LDARSGGSLVRERLDNVRETLIEYFGQQKQLAAGLAVTDENNVRIEPMEKPDMLLEYERCKNYNTLPYPGGLLAQPHMWLLEQDIVREIILLFEAMPNLALGAPNADQV